MKLLMISGDRSLAAGKPGAFSVTLEELKKHFERIDIICPRVQGERQVRTVFGNVHIHPSTSGLLFQPLFIARKGRELIQEHKIDTITVHDYPPFYNGIGARLLKRSVGIPAVLEIHHIVGHPHAGSLTEWIGRMLSRAFLPSHASRFSTVRVVNRATEKILESWGVKKEKLTIVPSVYLDHAAIEHGKNQPKKHDLVFCGRLAENKGLLEIIDAVSKIASASLLVIGDGPLRASAESRVGSLGIESRVTFIGWLPTPTDVFKSIASGRIFLMNSKSEGNPRVAIEAMALGLPVIATRVGIMPEVIQEGVNGWCTDGSVSDLSKKIGTALSEKEKIELMGQEASKVIEKFEKHSAIKVYAEFLKKYVV